MASDVDKNEASGSVTTASDQPSDGAVSAEPGSPSARRIRRSRGRPWRSIVFAPQGDNATRRRGSDGFRVVVSVIVIGLCLAVTLASSHLELSIAHFLTPPPNGISWLVSVVWSLGSLGMIAALSVVALLSRRPRIARDIAVSGLVAWVLCLILQAIFGSHGLRPSSPSLDGLNAEFPLARVAATIAVADAAIPYLSRFLQRTVQVVVFVTALATVVHGAGLPVSVIASLSIGWGVAAVYHLIVGSPIGLPSREDVQLLIDDLGVPATDVTTVPRQVWGVAKFQAGDDQGRLNVSVYGRDAADAQLLGKTLRFLFYRDSGPTLALSRLQQVEHEAYLSLLAARSGSRVPDVLAAGRCGPTKDAVLITRPPAGDLLIDLLPAKKSEKEEGISSPRLSKAEKAQAKAEAKQAKAAAKAEHRQEKLEAKEQRRKEKEERKRQATADRALAKASGSKPPAKVRSVSDDVAPTPA